MSQLRCSQAGQEAPPGWSTLESCVDASQYPSIQHGICWEKLVLSINMIDEKNMSVLFRAVSENLKSSPPTTSSSSPTHWGGGGGQCQWTTSELRPSPWDR